VKRIWYVAYGSNLSRNGSVITFAAANPTAVSATPRVPGHQRSFGQFWPADHRRRLLRRSLLGLAGGDGVLRSARRRSGGCEGLPDHRRGSSSTFSPRKPGNHPGSPSTWRPPFVVTATARASAATRSLVRVGEHQGVPLVTFTRDQRLLASLGGA
jgi:hypothetical protein